MRGTAWSGRALNANAGAGFGQLCPLSSWLGVPRPRPLTSGTSSPSSSPSLPLVAMLIFPCQHRCCLRRSCKSSQAEDRAPALARSSRRGDSRAQPSIHRVSRLGAHQTGRAARCCCPRAGCHRRSMRSGLPLWLDTRASAWRSLASSLHAGGGVVGEREGVRAGGGVVAL